MGIAYRDVGAVPTGSTNKMVAYVIPSGAKIGSTVGQSVSELMVWSPND